MNDEHSSPRNLATESLRENALRENELRENALRENALRENALREKVANLSPAKRALLEQKLRDKVAKNALQNISTQDSGKLARIERRATSSTRSSTQSVDGADANANTGADANTNEDNENAIPLSFAQERFWFFEQWHEGNAHQGENSSPLNRAAALRLKSVEDRVLDVSVLQHALSEIVRRHEALRTTFFTGDDGARQRVVEPMKLALPLHDLSGFSADEQDIQSQKYMTGDAREPFDLRRGPLLRTTLLRLNTREHLLLLTIHHIAFDGLSMAILVEELSALYQSFARVEPSTLPELPIQYADYALWQRAQMQGETLSRHLDFWRSELKDAPRVLDLPTARSRPPLQSTNGAQLSFALSMQLSCSLKALAQEEGATLFMTLLAALQTVLLRITNQDDVVVGTSVAGRGQVEVEKLIGFFVNTLVLRSDLSGDPTFREALARVRQNCIKAYAHADLPFEKLIEALQPTRDLSRTPLFQTLFVLKNAPTPTFENEFLRISPHEFETEIAHFDLALELWDKPEGVGGYFVYNTDLFDCETVARFASHLHNLLEGVVADADARLSQLPLSSETERRQLLETWNDTQRDYPRDKCVHELFEEQVEYSPHAVALRCQDLQMTYGELNARANRLARALRRRGVRHETPVGLCLERSFEMIVAVLGILKAGGAYVPIDPSQPRERIAFQVADARVQVLLSQKHMAPKLGDIEVDLFLDADWSQVANKDDSIDNLNLDEHNLDNLNTAQSLAYITYTSGSTGQPKGVCIEHRGVVRLVKNTNYIVISRDDVFSQMAPLAFDASTFEIWGALLNGAQLSVFAAGALSLEEIGQAVVQQKITVLWVTTGLYHQIVDEQIEALRAVRHILTGGEVISPAHIGRVRVRWPNCLLTNCYGPTENTTYSTAYLVGEVDENRPIPIGRPIANSQAYVLDDALQPLPIGVVGELCVSGDGLARGYLNRRELTDEKFVTAIWGDRSERLYRTGDRARRLADGNLDFVGRVDNQVKLRGFRIEPGEIEAALQRFPHVRECLVVVHQSKGDKRLIAYVVAEDRVLDLAELRAQLSQVVPDYMVPAAFVALAELPLTPNGKVDRRALPPPPETVDAACESVSPSSATESEMVKIWEELLSVRGIGVTDNFFDLGGHSLLAMRLFAHISKRWNCNLPLAVLFGAPTIRQLAIALDAQTNPVSSVNDTVSSATIPLQSVSIVALQPTGTLPPFFLVSPGGVFFLRELARCIGQDQPLYSVQARGLEQDEAPLTTVEVMAQAYVLQLREVQPRGPYYLGGRCFGGVVAFEMAQQLRAVGESVALLLIFDSSPPSSHLICRADKSGIRRRQKKSLRHSAAHLVARMRYYCNRDRIKALWKNGLKTRNHSPQARAFEELHKANRRAKNSYRATQYDSDITLIRSQEFAARTRKEGHLLWQNLTTKTFRHKVVAGTHTSMFEKPHVEVLARRIRQSLQQARAESEQLESEQLKSAHDISERI